MKVELELPEKPEVHAMAGILNIDPMTVVGGLIKVWGWFNKHTEDGNAHSVTYSLPDRITGVTGFGEAMAFVGWLEQHDKTLHMPKFERHTSQSAKSRALASQRVMKSRNKVNDDVNGESVNKPLIREEKRRDIYTRAFEACWEEYPRKVGKGAAWKSWSKLKDDRDLHAQIYQAIKAQKSADGTRLSADPQFIPHFATWLNSQGWLDEVAVPKVRELRPAL